MRLSALFLTLVMIPTYAQSSEEMWVTVDRLERRTCPSTSCGVAGQLMYRENAAVIERRDGWGRVSKYYDASCQDGASEYIKYGNKACTKTNGIVNGQFAEWVLLKSLSRTRPADPAANASGTAALIAASDDYRLHKDAFVRATDKLIKDGRCTKKDFSEAGGWMKSTTHRDKPIYFVYCGGMQLSNKLYLNVSSGEISR